ncbi:MAG: hypothetical protein ABWZ19_01100 [Hyphomicrobium sp.]
MPPSTLITAGAATVLLLAMATGVGAKIACNKGSQRVAGSWISTPYCQDAYVAAVAREYGFKASANAIRNDPLFKQRICRFIGQDIRIKDSCNEVNPAGRGWF